MAAEEATTAGIRWFYSPMVDISRDARWGRSTEGAGEDPYLGSAMARAYVRGYQNDTLAKPDSVAACVKHFAAY
jgi:beta-glucosidase